MALRTFEKAGWENSNFTGCPICGEPTEKEVILVPIHGTKKDNICQAVPVHTDCLSRLVYFPEGEVVGVVTVDIGYKEDKED